MAIVLKDLTGLPITCSNHEALSHYNNAVEVFIGQLANYLPIVEGALDVDPTFAMALCLQVSYYCDSLQFQHPKVISGLKQLDEIYQSVTEREKGHIDVVRVFVRQDHPTACRMWSQLTVDYPEDMYAAKWAFFVCRKTGGFDVMRDIMSRAVHTCSRDSSIYPYILSMYAFSLEETDQRDIAEKLCRESLELQPVNPWAVHTMSHIYEEERDVKKGVEFLTLRRSTWEAGPFGPHIAWHLMLFYLDLNEVDDVLLEYDKMLAPRVHSSNVLGLLDAASILWRLEVAGIDPGNDRWDKVTEAFKPRVENPQLSWLQSHLMMSLCHGNVTECTARAALAHRLVVVMKDYAATDTVHDCRIAKQLGVPMCDALLAFGEERYSDVVRIITPMKYDIISMGGSGAQRQIFLVTLIHAAIRGGLYREAMANIVELKAKKPHSRYIQRLYDQVTQLMIQQ